MKILSNPLHPCTCNHDFDEIRGRGCLDNLFLLRELALDQQFKKSGKKKPLLFAFLDIRKAFDRVCRPILWHRMYEMGIRGRFWRVVRNLFSGFSGRVKVGERATRPFQIDTGVVQGSRLGPTLFNIFSNELISEIKKRFVGATFSFGQKLPVLAFADDLVLCSNDPVELQNMLDFCSNFAQQNEFNFNTKKCKILNLRKKVDATLKLGAADLEVVDQYKYLGVPLGRGMHASSKPAPFGAYLERIRKKAMGCGRKRASHSGVRCSSLGVQQNRNAGVGKVTVKGAEDGDWTAAKHQDGNGSSGEWG